jgi:hypothetical protein
LEAHLPQTKAAYFLIQKSTLQDYTEEFQNTVYLAIRKHLHCFLKAKICVIKKKKKKKKKKTKKIKIQTVLVLVHDQTEISSKTKNKNKVNTIITKALKRKQELFKPRKKNQTDLTSHK